MRTVLIVDDNVELAGLLAVAVEAHGYSPRVVHTGNDALEAIESLPPDAALVDLLLPDMRGSEIIRALSERKIPSIAMSGVFKGDRFAQEATGFGAQAFFEKPFAAREMMLRLAELLEGPSAAPAPSPEDKELEQLPLDDEVEDKALSEAATELVREESAAHPPPPEPPSPPQRAEADDDDVPDIELPVASTTGAFAAQPSPPPRAPAPPPMAPPRVPAPALETSVPAAPPATPAVEAPGFGALTFSNREKTGTVPAIKAPPKKAAAADWPRAGDLSRTSASRLLTAFYQGQQTGELRVRRKEIIKVVYVEKGTPVYAASNVASERFGRFAVRMGKLPAEKLDDVHKEAQRANMRTGEAMLALGLLTDADRKALLEQQVKEIIWSLLDWKEGEYLFAIGKQPRQDIVRLNIFTANLLLEGLKRSLSLVKLRERIAPELKVTPTADPPYQLHELALTGPEAMLLAYADGTKTVEDLITLTELDERTALGLVHGLMQLGILEERRASPSNRRVVLV